MRIGAEDIDVEGVVVDHMEQCRDFGKAHAAHGARHVFAVEQIK